MRLITLFAGGPIPRPTPPRPPHLVVGVDALRDTDLLEAHAIAQRIQALAAICSIPGTPFSGRWQLRAE